MPFLPKPPADRREQKFEQNMFYDERMVYSRPLVHVQKMASLANTIARVVSSRIQGRQSTT
jgi:hypothetical protein